MSRQNKPERTAEAEVGAQGTWKVWEKKRLSKQQKERFEAGKKPCMRPGGTWSEKTVESGKGKEWKVKELGGGEGLC